MPRDTLCLIPPHAPPPRAPFLPAPPEVKVVCGVAPSAPEPTRQRPWDLPSSHSTRRASLALPPPPLPPPEVESVQVGRAVHGRPPAGHRQRVAVALAPAVGDGGGALGGATGIRISDNQNPRRFVTFASGMMPHTTGSRQLHKATTSAPARQHGRVSPCSCHAERRICTHEAPTHQPTCGDLCALS